MQAHDRQPWTERAPSAKSLTPSHGTGALYNVVCEFPAWTSWRPDGLALG